MNVRLTIPPRRSTANFNRPPPKSSTYHRRRLIYASALKTTKTSGNVTLTRNNAKVKVFTAASDGTEITFNGTDNKFPIGDLPKDLYVQGDEASDSMRDVTLTLTHDDDDWDSVKFTVIWVDPVDVSFSGTLANDNDKRDNYKSWTEANTYNLGLQKFNTTYSTFPAMGWGLEARGLVAPAEFDYPSNDLTLGRDWQVRYWEGAGNPLSGSQDFSATIPPGNDTGPAVAKDDNPTDSDPLGAIYDWDAPRLFRLDRPANEIRRMRANFKVFAQISVNGVLVRASSMREYYVRFSIKQLDAPSGTNWVVVDPPDVDNDNQASYGATAVTWNLQ